VRTLAEWLALQESVHARSIDLGLERVTRVARTLGVDKPPYRVITVAGTNGKGSTVACLESILRTSGVKCGAFTSPHLVRYNERIRVEGELATDEELVAVFERIESARGDTTLTFFEYNALAALLVFAEHGVEVAVLEVGLGGRLDATNIVDADVGIVCSIGYDHRDWLGDTLDAIGAEKAGIFRKGRPAVLGTPDLPQSVYRVIETLGAKAVIAERDFSWSIEGSTWNYQSKRLSLKRLPYPALAGAIQFRNAATSIAALEALGIPPTLEERNVGDAITQVSLPGRFQIVDGPVEWIFDVSHNEPAAQVLADNLRARPCSGRTIAVAGILGDKDIEAIGRVVKDVIDTWILCALPGPRGTRAMDLEKRLGSSVHTALRADSVESGCELARQTAQPGDRVVVFGSFSTVGSALQWHELYSRPRDATRPAS
jgi:dihydrofolate synthase / folylpolyglutamate synthase